MSSTSKQVEKKWKLDRCEYWMSSIDGLPHGTEAQIRSHIHLPGTEVFGVRLVVAWITKADISDTEELLRVLRIYADEDIYYWLLLSLSGTMAYSITPDLMEALLADEQVRDHFVGLFMSEPSWTPSLTHGFEFDHALPWFSRTHYCIPNRLGHQLGHGYGFVSGFGAELKPEHGAIIEPLPKPIENPVEAMEAFRIAFQRWAKPYLKQLTPDEVLTPMSWAGSKRHFSFGYENTKFAQALFPFSQWAILPEFNNFDSHVAIAEARGLERAGGAPWGTMAGGVRWKYHQLWLRVEGLPHYDDKSSISYTSSMDMPGWLMFVPLAASWAEGARIFKGETGEDQLLNNARVRASVRSFRELLEVAGPPMDPEIRTCLLKGAAYFTADVPGYENGMAEEIISDANYQCGRNTGHYEQTPASLVATFFPRNQSNRQWEDALLSGNPWGGFDILPAYVDADVLGRYDRLVMIDWNCLDDEQHQRLLRYVKRGGQLVIAAGQLFSQREGRIAWEDPVRDAMYRDGDLTELCGLTLAGGSVQCTAILEGTCLIQDPMSTLDAGDLSLYVVDRLSDGAETLVQTPDGHPVVVRHSVGQGSVVTVLGPSYSAALGHFSQCFFNWLAEENRSALSYCIDRVTPEESKDLLVYRDLGRKRVALCNYWRRFDMTPRLTLHDKPTDGPTVERIDVYDVEGLAASWQSPAQVRDQWQTWVSLPSHSIGVVRYEPSNDEHTMRFTWRAIRSQHLYATFDNVSSTTRRIGPVEVHTTRDTMSDRGTQPIEPDVRTWIELRVLDCRPGSWDLSVEVRDAHGNLMRTNTKAVKVAAGEPLVLPSDVTGHMFDDWQMNLWARKS